MSDTESLPSRLRAELFSASSVVTLTAAVLAVVAAYITQGWAGGDAAIGFGALLGVGIGVPTLYREWSVRFSVSAAFLWAAIASAIAYGFYALVFVLLTRFGVTAGLADGLAGGATIALGIAFSLYRTRTA